MLTPDFVANVQSGSAPGAPGAGPSAPQDLSNDTAYNSWKSSIGTPAPTPDNQNLLQKILNFTPLPAVAATAVRTGQAVGAAALKGADIVSGGAVDRAIPGGVDAAIQRGINTPVRVPVLGNTVKPFNQETPESMAGHALNTVAWGVGGAAAAGASMGAGNALENNAGAGQTAMETIAGALSGKILEHGFNAVAPLIQHAATVYGKPLLDSISHLVPDSAKAGFQALADKVANVVPEKILPDAASSAVNKSAAKVNAAVEKPFQATGKTVAAIPKTVKAAVSAAQDTKAGKVLLGGPTPEEALGQITQGKTKDLKPTVQALSAIDTKGVKTYEDLNGRFDKKIPELSAVVDKELSKDPTKYSLDSLSKTDKTNAGNEIKTDYVSQALKHLSELHDTSGDAIAKANTDELLAKAQSEGLTRKDVNDISRKYGTEFGDKAFSKVTGDPLTSVNAQKFENVRTGLKETARAGIGGDEAKAADQTLSSIFNTKSLTTKMQEGVNKLQQRIESRGLGEKIGHATMKTLDMLSGGALRGIVGGLLPRGAGYKVLNAVDLETKLARNLDLVRKATEAPTDESLMKVVSQIHSILSGDSSTALKTSAERTKPTTSPTTKDNIH